MPGRRRVRRSISSAAARVAAVATGAAVVGSCPAVSTSPPQCPRRPPRRRLLTQAAARPAATRLARSCRRRARRWPGPSRMCARFSRPRPICKTSPAHPPLPLALAHQPPAQALGPGNSSSSSSRTSLRHRQRAPRRHLILALFSPPCIRLHPCPHPRPCPCRTRPPHCICCVWSPARTARRRRTGRPDAASLRRLPDRRARMPPRLNRRSLRGTPADYRSDMCSLPTSIPYMKPSIFFLFKCHARVLALVVRSTGETLRYIAIMNTKCAAARVHANGFSRHGARGSGARARMRLGTASSPTSRRRQRRRGP